MKKIILRGIIADGQMMDSFYGIDLIQEDGYKVDLITRIKEFISNYGKTVAIRYWIAKEKEDDEKVKEGVIKKYLGYVEAEYEASHYEYSEYTSGTNYDTIFNIEGHNLYNELLGLRGKYLILEIEQAKKSS